MATSTIKFTAKTDISEFTAADFAKLTAADLSALSKTQAASLTSDQLAGFSATTLPAIAGVFKYLPVEQLAGISPKAIPGLPIKSISATQLMGLTSEQLAGLTSAQVNALSVAQVAALGDDLLGAIDPTGFKMATVAAQFDNLSTSQIAKLSSAQIASLTDTQIGTMTADQAAALLPAQALSFKSLTTLKLGVSNTPEAVQNLSPKFIAALSTKVLAGLTVDQLGALSDEQVKVLTSAQIGALDATKFLSLGADIAAIAPSALAGLSKSALSVLDVASLTGDNQFAALTSAQIGLLSTTSISNLNADHASALTAAKMAAITTAQASHIDSSVIGALTPSAFAGLTPNALKNFTTGTPTGFAGNQIQAITAEEAAVLSSAQLKALSGTQLDALTSDAVIALNPAAIKGITPADFDELDVAAFSAFTPAQIAGMLPAQVALLSQAQVESLGSSQVAALSSLQIKALNEARIGYLDPTAVIGLQSAAIKVLSPTVIDNIDADAFALFTSAQMAAFTPAQMVSLTQGQIQKFGAEQAGALSALQYAKIPAAVLSYLPSDSFGALKPEIIKGLDFAQFTSTQVSYLSPEQTAGITSKQIALLSNDDIKGFTGDALAAIKPDAFKGLANALSGLGSEAVSALTTAQLNAISTTQLETLTAGQVQYLSDVDAAFLSSKGYTTISVPGATTSGIETTSLIDSTTVPNNGTDSSALIIAGRKGVTIDGGLGDDTIVGSPTGDSITGGTGNDSIDAGAGNDIITFDSNDTIDGNTGNDTVKTTSAIGDNAVLPDDSLINVENVIVKSAATFSFINQTENLNISVDSTETSTLRHTIVGGQANDTISGFSAFDTITGGKGMDVLTGGAGGDTFKFAAGDNGDAPESKVFDTITDFGAGDIIDFDTTLTIETVSAEPTSGRASISALGLASFKSSDSTLSLRLTAVEDAITNGSSPTAGEVATFTVGGDSYLFVSDSTAGLSSNDILIKLQNKSMTGLVLDSGNIVVPYTVSEFGTAKTASLFLGSPYSDVIYIKDTSSAINSALSSGASLKTNDSYIDKVIISDTGSVTATVLKAIDSDAGTGLTAVIDASAISTITGSVADVTQVVVTNNATTIDSGAEAVTLEDADSTPITATDLSAIGGATTGTVTASHAIALSGSAAELTAALVTDGTKVVAATATVTIGTESTMTATALKAIDTSTTGLVDASNVSAITALAAADYTLVGGASATGNAVKTKAAVDVSLASTTTMTATALKAIDTNTTGIVDASLVDAITGLAAADYTIIGGTTVTGTNGILKTKADVNITLDTTTTMTAANLKTIDGNTTGFVDASNVSAITALAAADYTIIGGTTVTGTNGILKTKADVNITLDTTTTMTAANLKTIDGNTTGFVDASNVSAITALAAADYTIIGGTTVTGTNGILKTKADVNITLDTTTTMTAANLKTIDGNTTGIVDASNVSAITALAAADYTIIGGTTVTGTNGILKTKADVNITLDTTTTMTAANLKTIDGNTTGFVDASNVSAITALAAADYTIIGGTTVTGTNGILKTKADVNITLDTTTTMTAANLKTIDGNTTGIVDASLVDAITGLAAADYTIIGGTTVTGTNGILKTKADVNITLDTTTTMTAANLKTIDGNTTGFVDASNVSAITALAAADYTIIGGTTVTGTNGILKTKADVNITLDTTTTMTAANLKTIDGNTTGFVDASNVSAITALAAADYTIIGGTTVTGTNGILKTKADVNITLDTTTTMTAANLKTIDGNTTGFVDASNVSAITALAAADYTIIGGTTVTGTNGILKTKADVNITLDTTTTMTAANLKTIDGNTTGIVDASNVSAITALAAADYTIIGGTTVTGTNGILKTKADVNITLDTTTTMTAANLKTIDGNTTGFVDASNVSAITALAAADYTIIGGTTVTGTNGILKTKADVNITLDTTTTMTAANLKTIDGNTTGFVDASNVSAITALAAADYTIIGGTTVTGTNGILKTKADVNITLDTTTTMTAANLKTIDGNTTGIVDASLVDAITGLAAADYTIIGGTTVTGTNGILKTKADVNITLDTTTTMTAANLKTIDGNTTGFVDASNVSAITALAAADYTIIGGTTVTGTNGILKTKADVNITLDTTTTMTAANLKTIDGNTTGFVDASNVSAITALAAADYTIIGGTTVTGTNGILKTKADVNITLDTTTTMTAANLKTIDDNTTGFVDASLVDAITGLAAADYTIIGGASVTGTNGILKTKAAVNISLSDTATFEQLVALDSNTSGTITTTTANITATTGDNAVGYAEVGSNGFGNLDTFAIAASATLTAATAGMGDSADAFSFSGTGTLTYQGTAAATVANDQYMLVQGTWSGGTFTVDSSTGTSTLVLFDSDTGASAATSGVVLIGVLPSAITTASDAFSIT